MRKEEKNEKTKKMAKVVARKVTNVAKKTGKVWKAQPLGIKAMTIVMALVFIMLLPSILPKYVMFAVFIWNGFMMSQAIVAILVVTVVWIEVYKNGIISTVTRVMIILVIIKVASDMTGGDTKVIDMVLKRIADVPNLIVKDFIPWMFPWLFW